MFTRHLTAALWTVLGVVGSATWFFAGARLAHRWGLHEAAPALGVLAAAAVAATFWLLGRSVWEEAALTALRCPRCRAALAVTHEHARPSGVALGLQRWRCAACDYQHAEALTCAECAA